MTVAIGPATLQDAGALTDIAHQAKAHWGYPDAWIRRWSGELTIVPAYLTRAVVNVARIGPKPVAFYALVPLEGRRQDWELDHLWVSPGVMGRGIGRALLTHAAQQVTRRGGRSLFILSDPHAEAFYHALGAHSVGRAPAFMDGHERWLVEMELTIEPHPIAGF